MEKLKKHIFFVMFNLVCVFLRSTTTYRLLERRELHIRAARESSGTLSASVI